MQVLAVQLDTRWEDQAGNFDRVRELIDQARPVRGSIIALPEMFATGFTMKPRRTAEPVGGPTDEFLESLARTTGCLVIGGVVTAGEGKPTNDALIVSPEGIRLRQSKLHPFSHVAEDAVHAAGEKLLALGFGGLTLAAPVCYDLRFPEAFRAWARAGVDLFIVIANWPAVRAEQWLALLKARAIENHAYVAGINRTGRDPNVSYCGDTVVFSPLGEPLARADAAEQVLTAELSPEALAESRQTFCSLADMRSGLFCLPEVGHHSLG